MKDITDFTDDELIEELQRRKVATLVLTMTKEASRDQIGTNVQVSYSGCLYTAVGMAHQYIHDAMHNGVTESP